MSGLKSRMGNKNWGMIICGGGLPPVGNWNKVGKDGIGVRDGGIAGSPAARGFVMNCIKEGRMPP